MEHSWDSYDPYGYNEWTIGSWNEYGWNDPAGDIQQGFAASTPDGSRQVVAQQVSGGVSDYAPRWDGQPSTFDTWGKSVRDWSKSVKLPPSKMGHLLHKNLPNRVKERIRSEINNDRMESANWRESVSAEDAFYHYEVGEWTTYKDNLALVAEEQTAQRLHQRAVCAKQAGVDDPFKVPTAVVETAVRRAMEIGMSPTLGSERPTILTMWQKAITASTAYSL